MNDIVRLLFQQLGGGSNGFEFRLIASRGDLKENCETMGGEIWRRLDNICHLHLPVGLIIVMSSRKLVVFDSLLLA